MNTLSITFDLRIRPQQIYDFRGAIIHLTGGENGLFHNREVLADGSVGKPLERYPKIQYRIIDGKATLWGLDEGAAALKQLSEQQLEEFEMFGVQTPLRIIHQIEDYHFQPGISAPATYRIRHFIPLNDVKDKEWNALDTYTEKIKMLEQILLNELVLFSYAVQWELSEKLQVQIKDILHQSTARYKTREGKQTIYKYFKSFDIVFRVNALLPDGISLGRHKAYGYGILTREE